MKAASFLLSAFALLGIRPRSANAFDYNITSIDSQILTDNKTQITNLQTIFIDEVTLVAVGGGDVGLYWIGRWRSGHYLEDICQW